MIGTVTDTIQQNMTNWSARVLARVGINGPMPLDYAAVDIAAQWIYAQMDKGIAKTLIHDMVIEPHRRYQRNRGAYPNVDFNIILDVWDRPRGYYGDGAILTKMYNAMEDRVDNGSSPKYYRKSRWDHYVCSKPELLALQHRKEMFSNQMLLFKERGADSFLEFGCGEGDYCRMAKSLFSGTVAGIDKDTATINICRAKNDGVTYIVGDALDSHMTSKFSIMYASGLFDYLTDDECVNVLTIMRNAEPKFIMVGNANQTPSTKAFFGLLGWELYNRSAADLVKLYDRVFRHEKYVTQTDKTGCMNFLVVELG